MSDPLYHPPRGLYLECGRLWQAYLSRANDRRHHEFNRALREYVLDRGLAVAVMQWPTVWPNVLHLFSKGPTPDQDLAGVIRFVVGVNRALQAEAARAKLATAGTEQ